jgi:pimeloyl-ACP methyl ester carboxylesterase
VGPAGAAAASAALAVDLPGRGSRPADRRSLSLEDAVDSVTKDVETWGVDRVILVAHSFSGILVPALATRLGDRVAAVVLVGASVPEEGKGWVDLQPPAQRAILRLLYRLRPGGMLSGRGANRRSLGNDLDKATTTMFLDRRVPEAPRLLLDPVSPVTIPAATARTGPWPPSARQLAAASPRSGSRCWPRSWARPAAASTGTLPTGGRCWWRRWRSGSDSTTELGCPRRPRASRAVAAYTTLLGWLQPRRAVPDAAPETADGGDRSRLMLAHVVDLLVEGGKPR